MSNRIEDALTIVATGNLVTSGVASARIAIPVNAAGQAANVVRIICPVAATYAYVRPGNSTVTATTSNIAVNTTELLLEVGGCTHIAYIEGSTAAVINISPVEW